MLSYRHQFHAGNHADVLKHVVLVALLRALTRKDKPLCYLDTHAGRGTYPLPPPGGSPAPEWPDGLGRIFAVDDLPGPVADWLRIVRECAGGGDDVRHYPGSPMFAARVLRPRDRLILSELHPADAETLIAAFADDARVEADRRDGHAQITRSLPPRERRALLLVDPAYERREEIEAVRRTVDTALARLAHATIALWYPITRTSGCERLLAAPPGPEGTPLLQVEIAVRPRDNPIGLNGSGLLIWNPPFGLDTTLGECLPWLAARLDQGGGGEWCLEWRCAPT
ncbi:MAG TPA: 23S rRNA (adenine(2030)-N(6))-methyltransferase RlmJ [Gammaproteobacteria bacterium]|nr:23S rRNA (adenine(2030)-N(6))-methyltransferase RlmJ [Gammaproteobacteria bacterium]